MSTSTMSRLSAAVTVLASLTEKFPDLSALSPAVSVHCPDRLALTAYDGLSAFEEWRSALGIDLTQVSMDAENGVGPLMWLETGTVIDGVTVRLIGFGQVPVGHSEDATEPVAAGVA
ncbi:hypothetical protein ACIQ9I_21185 [Streptomyces sp. NPDC094461]|uniref:hypothetical protein n=1 Tax=Streptomyces sp. NPDC094461 TaxID=3366064 RepID=UPI00383096DB